MPESQEEHGEVVRRVEELFKLADVLQRRYEVAFGRAEKLTPSLLAKAFRGELVPQNPNDESAGEMLERFRVHGINPLRRRGNSKAVQPSEATGRRNGL